MFDAHIQYYAYNNLEGDDFGVGYLGNKEDWVRRVNAWGRNEGSKQNWTAEEWEDIDTEAFMGVQLAEVEPDQADLLVTWCEKSQDNVVRITKKHEVIWEENATKSPLVPRWVNRLQKMIKEKNLS